MYIWQRRCCVHICHAERKGDDGWAPGLSYMGHVVTALSTQMSVFLKRSFFYAFGPFVHTGQLKWTLQITHSIFWHYATNQRVHNLHHGYTVSRSPRVSKRPLGMRFQVCWSGRRLFTKPCHVMSCHVMSLSEPLIPFHGVAGCCCWSQSQPCLGVRAGYSLDKSPGPARSWDLNQ